MRQHSSVLMLAARGSICKVILLLVAMAAAEAGLFALALKKHAAEIAEAAPAAAEAEAAGDSWAWELTMYNTWSLEEVFTNSRIHWVFAVGLILLCFILAFNLSAGRSGYTLRRLSVSERAIGIGWAVYNVVILFIFWAAQVVIALALCRLFLTQADPAAVHGQTVFLAFYRQSFLHGLLPLAEVDRWVCNIGLLAGLGITASCAAYRLRHGRKPLAVFVLAALAAVTFNRGLASYEGDWAILVFTIAVTAGALWNLKGVCENAD